MSGPVLDAVGDGLGDLVNGRVLRRKRKTSFRSGTASIRYQAPSIVPGRARLDRLHADRAEVVPQVEIGRAQLVAEHGAVQSQPQGLVVGIGGQGEEVRRQVEVAQLIMVRGALGVELEGLFVRLPRLVAVAQVVLGLGQHVVGGIVVAILQERIEHPHHVVPALGGRVQLAQHLARLDVVRRRLEDLLQVRDGLLVLAGIAVRPGQRQPVAGLGLVGGDGLVEQSRWPRRTCPGRGLRGPWRTRFRPPSRSWLRPVWRRPAWRRPARQCGRLCRRGLVSAVGSGSAARAGQAVARPARTVHIRVFAIRMIGSGMF